MLCRKVSAESDTLMFEFVQNNLSDEEIRAWLTAVIEAERKKIANLAVQRRTLFPDPAAELRHDHAMCAAWEHVGRYGIHAPAAPDEDELIAENIRLLREDLTKDGRLNAIRKAFLKLTGREDVTAPETLNLLDLYIQGMRYAWRNRDLDDQTIPYQQIIDSIYSAAGSGTESPETRPSEVVERDQEVLTINPELTAVVARMNDLKRQEGIEEKTLRQYESFAALFSTLTGIRDIRDIRQSHVTSFRADLYKLPKSWGKSPRDTEASRDDIIAHAASLPPDKVGLSTGTINRHLEHLAQIVTWANDEGIPVDPKLNPARLRRKDNVRDRDKRDAFTEDQLRRVHQSPVWQGSKSDGRQLSPGDKIIRNGIYWCPLIAAYTGARRAEIAGLTPDDIIEVESVPCFNIDNNALRRIKNLPSKRQLPIHSHLIELGFLDHVEAMRAKGSPALFPDMGEKNGLYGRKLGRVMRAIIDAQLGEKGTLLSFHSYRHYVQNALDAAGVDDRIVRDIIGHEGRDVHERVYRKVSPVAELKMAIEELPRIL